MARSVIGRGQKFLTEYDDVLRAKVSTFTIHDSHYTDDGLNWAPTVEEYLLDTSVAGYTRKFDRVRHILRIGDASERLWLPRREYSSQSVTAGRPEYYTNRWRNVAMPAPIERSLNNLDWDSANIRVQTWETWRQSKVLLTLKNVNAPMRFRYPVTLTGLSQNGQEILAGSLVVGFIPPAYAWDANNNVVPVLTSYDGGYYTIEVQPPVGFDAWPIYVDPTLTDQSSLSLDTILTSAYPTATPYGESYLKVGEEWYATDTCRSLTKFDLSSATSGDSVSSATLSLWHYEVSGSNTRDLKVYRTKRAWVEAQACWNVYSTGNSWSTAGGFHTDDCEQTSIGSRSFTGSEVAGEKQWSLDTTAIAAMLGSSPSFTNNGFLIKADTEYEDQQRFRSSEYSTSTNRPKIVVVHSSGGGGTTYNQSTGGYSLAPTGGVAKSVAKALGAYSISPLGTVVKATSKTVGSHSVAPTGSVLKSTAKTIGAFTLSPAGALARAASKAVGGFSLSLAGSVSGMGAFSAQVGGATVALTGGITKAVSKVLGGHAISPAGSLAKTTAKSAGGATISPSGNLVSGGSYTRDVGGATISPSGGVSSAPVWAEAVGGAIITLAGAVVGVFNQGSGFISEALIVINRHFRGLKNP